MSQPHPFHPGDERLGESQRPQAPRASALGASAQGAAGESSPEAVAWLESRWEAARDAALPAGERARFHELLAASPRLRALWRAESDWLALMGDPEPELEVGDGFTGAVLERWAGEELGSGIGAGLAAGVASARESESGLDSGAAQAPLAFPGRWVAGRWPVAAAAAVALTLTLGVLELVAPGGSSPGPIAHLPIDPPPLALGETPSPVTALVGEFHDQFAGGASLLRRGIDTTRQALRIEGVWALMSSVSVPDPADYVEPVTQ